MTISGMWRRYFWGNRSRHRDLDSMSSGRGIYFIGCGDKIVYIGQSISLTERSIESLARYYHQIDDITLPWSIGFAPVHSDDDCNELESTAIRKYAPIFNTSIPSKTKSEGEELKVTQIFRVFADQNENCAAFDATNMEQQAREALANPSPPWEQGHKRRK